MPLINTSQTKYYFLQTHVINTCTLLHTFLINMVNADTLLELLVVKRKRNLGKFDKC